MRNINTHSLSFRLPAIIVCLGLAVACITAAVGYLRTKTLFLEADKSTSEMMLEDRKNALQSWIKAMETHAITSGSDPSVRKAVTDFSRSWRSIPGNQTEILQNSYIHSNPYPVGQKHRLMSADENTAYNDSHRQLHPLFRKMLEGWGLYDIFLISEAGDLVYSVFKEHDYATNLIDGEYANSGLAEAFRRAKQGQAGRAYFVDFAPYAPSNGAAASFLSTRIESSSGEFLGIFAVQLPTDEIREIMVTSDLLGDTGDILLVGPDFKLRNPSRFDDGPGILASIPKLSHVERALNGERTYAVDMPGIHGPDQHIQTVSVDFLGTPWAIVAEKQTAEVMIPLTQMRNFLLLQIGVSALIILLIGVWLSKTITDPIERLKAAMARLADGDDELEIPDLSRKDEIGSMASELQTFKEKLNRARLSDARQAELQSAQKNVVDILTVRLEGLSEGDLTQTLDTAFPEEYEPLRRDFNRTVGTLHEVIGSVIKNTTLIRSSVKSMSEGSDDLSTRTEHQAATVEETAAAIEEITSSVQSAAEGAAEVEITVSEARGSAERSGEVVEAAVEAMGQIEKSSDHISQIIGVIDDIAFQTNLLALNAGVEAARAGDAGRGFAVVASEVRALAQRSSEAAKEIKSLITESSGHVERGVMLVGNAGDALKDIVARVSQVEQLVGEIASSANEQSIGLSEINIGVTQLDQVTQQNAGMVEQSSNQGKLLQEQAEELVKLIERFQTNHSTSEHIVEYVSKPSKPSKTPSTDQPAKSLLVNKAPDTSESFVAINELEHGIWQDF